MDRRTSHDHRDAGQGTNLEGSAYAGGRIRHAEPVGRRHRPAPRRARLRSAGDNQRGARLFLGRRDAEGAISRDEALANARRIVDATPLPVSADLENGFGDSPEEVAKTIRQASETGLAGGSIEDATGNPDRPIYDHSLAVERIAAAVEAVRSLPVPFVLTARAENFLYGRPDLDDTIRRLQAFGAAGAEVLYAPGPRDRLTIETICRSVDKPVNVVMGLGPGVNLSVGELAAAGVKRISLGSSLSRAALGAFLRAAREVSVEGTFAFAKDAVGFRDLDPFFPSRQA